MASRRYVPYAELGDTPNVIVDGAAAPSTRLVLSHWPRSGSPRDLARDTSAEIVLEWLARGAPGATEVVSNNHFDQDGLAGVWAVLEPGEATARAELLEDFARAGDFGTFRDRRAARVAMAVSAFADPDVSPLDAAIFRLPYPEKAAALYRALLPRLARLLDAPDEARSLWEAEDADLARSERAVASGDVQIEEREALDLAIVTLPEALVEERAHRFTSATAGACHPMAIHNATQRFRVLMIQGRRYRLDLRYETWVQYASRRPLGRPDLSPLAARLNELEKTARWTFDGVGEITPSLRMERADESTIDPERFRSLVETFLASAPPAWDPYG